MFIPLPVRSVNRAKLLEGAVTTYMCVNTKFLRQNTCALTVPLSTQVYKWEPANCFGDNWQNAWR